MIALLLGLLAADTTLDAAERAPAALVILTPGSADAALDQRLAAATDRALAEHTGLRGVSLAELGAAPDAVARCPPQRLLGCAVTVVEARERDVPALIIVSALPTGDGRGLLRAIGLDLVEARRAREAAGDDEAAAENRMFARARELEATEVSLTDEAALAVHLAKFAASLVEVMRAAEPLGTIGATVPAGGAEVALDDRALGSAPAGALTVEAVRPGSRVLRLSAPGTPPIERTLEVRSGRLTRVALASADEPVAERWTTSRAALRWSGVALGVAGAALTVVGAVSGGGVREGCLTRGAGGTCEGLGAPGFGFDAGAAPTARADDVNPPSVPPLSLGLGLLGTGAAWSLGVTAIGGDEDHPWWIAAGGIALGALAFTVAALSSS